ncbi:MAG: DMT family transporter, partial [Ahrensia sp.]
LGAPNPVASAIMAVSGIAWGIYSIRGKASSNPLAATAGNFVLAVPFGAVLAALALPSLSVTGTGVLLALISGAVTSGLGYALWYRVLGRITQTQGAIVQLTVPVIAAFGGVVLLGEAITMRLSLASLFILGGVALAIVAKAKRAA